VIGSTLSCGATAGLHALGAARRSLRAQIFASVAFVVGGLAGAYFGGTLGTMRARQRPRCSVRWCGGGSCISLRESGSVRPRRARFSLTGPAGRPQTGRALAAAGE
jgi:hypothetical protein